MKKLFLFFLLISFTQIGFSQIQEEERSMSEGIQPGFVLTIPSAKEKFVVNTWKSYLKENSIRTKRNKKTDEYTALDVKTNISISEVQFYSRIELNGSNGVAILWIKDGENFISGSTHPEEAKKAEIFMMKFALKLTIELTKEELKNEEKLAKKLGKTQDKLQSKKKSLEKTIKKAKETIVKSEKAIETNLEEQEKVKEEISKQDDVVKDVKRKLSNLEIDY